MKNDYIGMFISVIIMIFTLSLIIKFDNKNVEHKVSTNRYTVYKKTILDNNKKIYLIKCVDSNYDMFTMRLESIPNVINVDAESLYNFIKEGNQYDFMTIYYKRAYGTYPKTYILGFSEIKNKNTRERLNE